MEKMAPQPPPRAAADADSDVEAGDAPLPPPPKRVLYVSRSLRLLPPGNPVRRTCIAAVGSIWFRVAALLAALAYLAVQAVNAPLEEPSSPRNRAVAWSSLAFVVLCTAEAAVKVVAAGLLLRDGEALADLWRRRAAPPPDASRRGPSRPPSAADLQAAEAAPDAQLPFLRSGWNAFDAALIVVGWASFAGGVDVTPGAPTSALRCVLLLKLLSALPAFRFAVEPVAAALPRLSALLAMSALVIITWTVAGLALFQNQLHQNCFYTQIAGVNATSDAVAVLPYCEPGAPANVTVGGAPTCTPTELDPSSGPGGQLCSTSTLPWSGYACPAYLVPDNGASACTPWGTNCTLTCAAKIDGAGAGGNPEWGQFSLNNFSKGLVVAYGTFTAMFWSQATSFLMDATGGWAFFYVAAIVVFGFVVCYNLIVVVLCDSYASEYTARCARSAPATPLGHVAKAVVGDGDAAARAALVRAERWAAARIAAARRARRMRRSTPVAGAGAGPLAAVARAVRAACRALVFADPTGPADAPLEDLPRAARASAAAAWRALRRVLGSAFRATPPPARSEARASRGAAAAAGAGADALAERRLGEYAWVLRRGFAGAVVAAVVGSTAALALQYESMSQEYSDVLDDIGAVCTYVFVAEVGVKLVGLGPSGYFGVKWNCFDFAVTVVAVAGEIVPPGGDDVGLRVLHGARALRLVSAVPHLRRFMGTLLATLLLAAPFICLIVYGVTCFAILGMVLFGAAWTYDTSGSDTPITNFNNFPNAVRVVMNNVHGTAEDTLFYAMYRTSPAAAAFYAAETFVGALLLLNMVISILYGRFRGSYSDAQRRAALATRRQPPRAAAGGGRRRSAPGGGGAAAAPADTLQQVTAAGHAVRTRVATVLNAVLTYVVLLDCAALFARSPGDSQDERDVIFVIECATFAFYVLDLALRLRAQGGAFFDPRGGATSREDARQRFFNLLDLGCVVTAGVGLGFYGSAAGRALSAARPLLLLGRVERLKVVTWCFVGLLGAMGGALLVGGTIVLVYAIMGIELFSGRFAGCSSESCCAPPPGGASGTVAEPPEWACAAVTDEATCVGTAEGTTDTDCVWIDSPYFGFANIGQAVVTLVMMLSGESLYELWDAVWFATDGVLTPWYPASGVPDWTGTAQRWVGYAYIVSFYIIGFVFMLNLVIGLIIDRYVEQLRWSGPFQFCTDAQRRWVELQRFLLRFAPRRAVRPPKLAVRRWLFALVPPPSRRRAAQAQAGGEAGGKGGGAEPVPLDARPPARAFKALVAAAAVVETVMLAFQHWDQAARWDDNIRAGALAAGCVLCLDSALKLVAQGPAEYLRIPINYLDFSTSWLALPSRVMTAAQIAALPPVVNTVVQLPALLVPLRLARHVAGAPAIADGVLVAAPSLANAALLMLVIVLVFAVVGVEAFYGIMPTVESYFSVDFFNFQRTLNAFLMLVVSTTGDAWNGYWQAAAVQEPYCSAPYCIGGDYSTQAACEAAGLDWWGYSCGTRAAGAYFVLYIGVIFFFMLNVLIAAVLDGFNACEADRALGASLRDYERLWPAWDPGAAGELPPRAFAELLGALRGCLGWPLAARVAAGGAWPEGAALLARWEEADAAAAAGAAGGAAAAAAARARLLAAYAARLDASFGAVEGEAGDGVVGYHEGLQKLTAAHFGVAYADLPADAKRALQARHAAEARRRAWLAAGGVPGAVTRAFGCAPRAGGGGGAAEAEAAAPPPPTGGDPKLDAGGGSSGSDGAEGGEQGAGGD